MLTGSSWLVFPREETAFSNAFILDHVTLKKKTAPTAWDGLCKQFSARMDPKLNVLGKEVKKIQDKHQVDLQVEKS